MTEHTEHELEQDEYRKVYDGITAVAARCDGAVTQDKVGFNGQDTAFGRRIASVPFEQWTDSVKWEAARIARTYRTQIETYTGIDVLELGVVTAIDEGTGSSTAARTTARNYEKAAKAEAQRDALVAQRKAQKLADGTLALSWNSKDPDCFGELLAEVKRLPGRRWTGSVNVVDLTPAAVEFIQTYGLTADFELAAPAPEAKVVKPHVVLKGSGVNLRFNNEADFSAQLAAVRSLPGRRYVGSDKSNDADLSPEVLAFAEKFGLIVADDVLAALSTVQADAAVAIDQAGLLRQVSRSDDPTALPEAFLAQLVQTCSKVEVA